MGAGSVRWEEVLEGMNSEEQAVRQMVLDLKAGTRPARGRSVPVLEVSPKTEVAQWLLLPPSELSQGAQGAVAGSKGQAKTGGVKAAVYRTIVDADGGLGALLSVKHGYMDISVNGVQLLTVDSPYSSQQQVQLELQKGLNLVEVAFRKLKSAEVHPPIFLCDMTGQELVAARTARDAAELKSFFARWDAEHAADANAVKVQAVPNLLQFSPKEIRVKAGQPLRLVFENPDLMQHNLVLVDIGAEEEVGGLADQMAAKPDAFAKHFIPASPKVLKATPLVNPNGRAELEFQAPMKPGSYPYICTFPGHWRVMRGILVVE